MNHPSVMVLKLKGDVKESPNAVDPENPLNLVAGDPVKPEDSVPSDPVNPGDSDAGDPVNPVNSGYIC